LSNNSQAQVDHLGGGDGTAKGQAAGHADHGGGGSSRVDDVAHAHRQNELGEENHTRHYGNVGSQPSDLSTHPSFSFADLKLYKE
jgi:hypothetical protein